MDTQIAWMINEGTNYLASGDLPKRRGNAHPNIVPYDVFACADGYLILAVGNDGQFQRFCDFLGVPDLARDPDYATNPSRLANRDALLTKLVPLIQAIATADLIAGLETRKVPVGPVQTLDQVFGSDQVKARDMIATIPSGDVKSGEVQVIGNPLKLSKTPVTYRSAPPIFGADTERVLSRIQPKR